MAHKGSGLIKAAFDTDNFLTAFLREGFRYCDGEPTLCCVLFAYCDDWSSEDQSLSDNLRS